VENEARTRITLIQRIQQDQRDEVCWVDFVDCYRNYVHAIIRGFNLEESLCDDLLQETLLRLWKDLPKFEYRPNQCKFRTWLGIVTRNVVKTYLKSKAGRNARQNVEYVEAYHAVDAVSDADIERLSELEWKVFITEKAVENLRGSLSAKIMTVLEGTLAGRSTEDLARELEVTPASLHVYRQRGRNAMKKEILRLTFEIDCE
jgi:RNA polymerase sigma factor (sigma-70 family)